MIIFIFQANCVPGDQNILEIVLPKIENLRPNMFIILFAVHGEHDGYGADLSKLKNLRLSGNPCYLTDVIWHKDTLRTFSGFYIYI